MSLPIALFTGAAAVLAPPVASTSPASPPPATTSSDEEEGELIIVQATRSNRRIGEEPVRVDVIDREEIEEKILMRPGNVAMILSETGGLRVQATAPAIGAANIRVQGLDGRFTQLLADGLPLYGGQASSLGLLQIPPTDLGRVEVIKGSVSALYGASALGGVINLVSRRPGNTPTAEVLLNATSRDGQDATAYLATPLGGGLSASLTGGLHRQSTKDLDGDGWIDIPSYDRRTVRPRLFWQSPGGFDLFLTGGAMHEDRRGGTMPGSTVPDGTPFPLSQHSERYDAGLIAKAPLNGTINAQVRAAYTLQDHRHGFGPVIEIDRHDTRFAEFSLAADLGRTEIVGGAAYQRDDYHSRTRPAFDYSYRVPGFFGQIEHELANTVTFAGSGRLDIHNVYGRRFSPRLSLLWKPERWTMRASLGRGYYAPTPFVEEIEAAGLARLEPLNALMPEVATNATLDIGYKRGAIEANFTLFGSNLSDATELLTVAPDRVRLVNIAGTTRIRGLESLLRYRSGEFVTTASYVFIDASDVDPATGDRRTKPLTPRHSAGLVGMWERPDAHRVGLELYYTGRQKLEDDTYRVRSKPYFELGVLAEKTLGPVKLFINAENILNVRQTRYSRMVRPSRAADGRWTVDAWAPTEGFVVNGGIRLRLGR